MGAALRPALMENHPVLQGRPLAVLRLRYSDYPAELTPADSARPSGEKGRRIALAIKGHFPRHTAGTASLFPRPFVYPEKRPQRSPSLNRRAGSILPVDAASIAPRRKTGRSGDHSKALGYANRLGRRAGNVEEKRASMRCKERDTLKIGRTSGSIGRPKKKEIPVRVDSSYRRISGAPPARQETGGAAPTARVAAQE